MVQCKFLKTDKLRNKVKNTIEKYFLIYRNSMVCYNDIYVHGILSYASEVRGFHKA